MVFGKVKEIVIINCKKIIVRYNMVEHTFSIFLIETRP